MTIITLPKAAPLLNSVQASPRLHVPNIINELLINLKAVGNATNEQLKLATDVFHLQVKIGTQGLYDIAKTLSEIEHVCLNREYRSFAYVFAGASNLSITLAGIGYFITDLHEQGLFAAVERMKTGENFHPGCGKVDILPGQIAATHAAMPGTQGGGLPNDPLKDFRDIAKANAGLLLLAARKKVVSLLWSITGFLAAGVKEGAVILTNQCRHKVVPLIKNTVVKVASRFSHLPPRH